MTFDITQLRKIRKQLDMTQHKMAYELGISQSMVAKIENGKLDPTYSYVKKIEDKIMHLTKHDEKEAGEIMSKNIFSVNKNDLVKYAINLMMNNEISQVVVVEKDNVIGLVSDNSLLGADVGKINNKKCFEIMADSPPIIDKHAKIEMIVQLLKFYPILIVKESGKLAGVITKSDVIKSLK
ncbi:MAG: CBS domain-containing protein [Nanoarchaeota archaeon]